MNFFFVGEKNTLLQIYLFPEKSFTKNVKSEGHNEIFFKKNENIECKVFILQQGIVCNF